MDHGPVIATGGGIVTQPVNLPLLKHLGFITWLEASTFWYSVAAIWFISVSETRLSWRRPVMGTVEQAATANRQLAKARFLSMGSKVLAEAKFAFLKKILPKKVWYLLHYQ